MCTALKSRIEQPPRTRWPVSRLGPASSEPGMKDACGYVSRYLLTRNARLANAALGVDSTSARSVLLSHLRRAPEVHCRSRDSCALPSWVQSTSTEKSPTRCLRPNMGK